LLSLLWLPMKKESCPTIACISLVATKWKKGLWAFAMNLLVEAAFGRNVTCPTRDPIWWYVSVSPISHFGFCSRLASEPPVLVFEWSQCATCKHASYLAHTAECCTVPWQVFPSVSFFLRMLLGACDWIRRVSLTLIGILVFKRIFSFRFGTHFLGIFWSHLSRWVLHSNFGRKRVLKPSQELFGSWSRSDGIKLGS